MPDVISAPVARKLASLKVKDVTVKKLTLALAKQGFQVGRINPCIYGICIDFFTDKTPYGEAIDPEVAAAVRGTARLLESLGHHVEERAPTLAVEPSVVAPVVISANTAVTVRAAEQLFGRAMNRDEFETYESQAKTSRIGLWGACTVVTCE